MTFSVESLMQARLSLEKYHSVDGCNGLVRPEIRNSWQRCLRQGLRPSGKPKEVHLTGAEVRNLLAQNERLLYFARRELKKLHSQLPNGDAIINFGNSQAILLEVFLNRRTSEVWAGLAPGLCGDESICGTSGFTLAAICKQLITIGPYEHFFSSSPSNFCTASPVMDPNGDVAGIIDVSYKENSRAQHIVELVSKSASNIEDELFREQYGANAILQFCRSGEFACSADAGLIALTDEGEILGYNGRARHFFEVLPFHPKHHFDELFRMSFRNFKASTSRQCSLTNLADLKGNPFSVKVCRPCRNALPARSFLKPAADFVHEDSAVATAISVVKHAVQIKAPILIIGETGTGKEELAAYSHQLSGRCGMLVSINCAAVPEDLIEAELFGYHEGAFTGARSEGSLGLIRLADRGTLFLDEIGDMSMSAQAALLRFLDNWTVRALGSTVEHKVDIQLIAASGCALQDLVAERKFRRDLLYRLSTIEVFLPPLRVRSDFREIVSHLLHRLKPEITIQEEGMLLLEAQPWEGNIRELKNVLTRLVIATSNLVISADEVASVIGNRRQQESSKNAAVLLAVPVCLSDINDNTVLSTYRRFGGNVSSTARQLSVSRNTVYRALRRSKRFLRTPNET